MDLQGKSALARTHCAETESQRCHVAKNRSLQYPHLAHGNRVYAMEARKLAQMIDHTLLAPEATPIDVAQLCSEAVELQVGAICISPSFLPLAAGALPLSIKTAVVVGFLWRSQPRDKALEAKQACDRGAQEIDMVINLALVSTNNWAAVTSEVATVRAAIPSSVILKVIIESALWSDLQIVGVCTAAVRVVPTSSRHRRDFINLAAHHLMLCDS